MGNQFSLDDKTILITGASSGIGRATAILCSELGANIILLGRNLEGLEVTYKALSSGKHFSIALDLKEYGQYAEAVSDAVHNVGRIDGFVHAAGSEIVLPLKASSPKTYEELFAVNVVAGFELAKHITKRKNRSDTLSMLFFASIAGVVGQPAHCAYSAAKGAVIAGVRSLAMEFSKLEIRVNSISPGFIKGTKMSNHALSSMPAGAYDLIVDSHPLGIGNVNDISWQCAFLLSDQARWITGTNVIIDGGYCAQ